MKELNEDLKDYLKNEKSAGMYKPNFLFVRKKGMVMVYSRNLKKYKAIGRTEDDALKNLIDLLGAVANRKELSFEEIEEMLNPKKPWYKKILGYFFDID